MRLPALILSTALLAACNAQPMAPKSVAQQVRSYVADRLPPEHPLRGQMLVYVSTLDQSISRPDDMEATRATMIADNCLGILPGGYLPSDLRHEVTYKMTDTSDRKEGYRRYVMNASTIALTREEAACITG